jgi:hypothetical protein
VTTTPSQVKVLCTSDNASILADGASTALITAGVSDAGNQLVDTATDNITFSVSGQGTLLNTTQKNASSGLATVQLQSTTNTGTATVNATSSGLTGGTVEVTTSSTAVNPPTGLAVTGHGRHSLDLSWQPGADNVRFAIDRSTNGVVFTFIKIWGDVIESSAHTDTELIAGVTYWYRVYGYEDADTMSLASGVVEKCTESVEDEIPSGELKNVNYVEDVRVTVPADTFSENSYLDILKSPDNNKILDADKKIGELFMKLVSREIGIDAFNMSGIKWANEGDFQETMTLEIDYDEADMLAEGIAEESLRMYVLNEGESVWEKVEGEQVVNTEQNYVSAEVEHFSIYCLIGSKGMEIFNVANYPNPMTNETVFTFELTMEAAEVKINVYTLSGRLVKSFTETNLKADYNEIPVGGTWNGRDEAENQLSSGVYLYRITATPEGGSASATATGKLVIMK